MRTLRRLYYRIFKRYRRLELRFVSYAEGTDMIFGSWLKPETEQWRLAHPEEDTNRTFGKVYLERRERITQ